MAKPNRVWVTDITHITADEGWFYLVGIKGLFNGELVGYVMSGQMTTTLVLQALFCVVAANRLAKGTNLPFGLRQPVRLSCVSEATATIWYVDFDEPQGRLLGQCADGEFLRLPEK